ncbi:MAG: hypothetical protein K1X82_08850 [Bacteroidia bacterium]|nr:hypothetical protein [Bacteroidia bacterium]
MKKVSAFLMFLALSFSIAKAQSTSSAAAEPLLHGKTYTIRIKQVSQGKKGTEYGKEEAEEFSFKAGKFKTLMFARDFQMPVKPYEITNVDSATGTQTIYWECNIDWSETDKVVFKGEIEGGNAIKGTVEWTVKNKPKKTLNYEFVGELKEKKKKTPPTTK